MASIRFECPRGRTAQRTESRVIERHFGPELPAGGGPCQNALPWTVRADNAPRHEASDALAVKASEAACAGCGEPGVAADKRLVAILPE